MQYKKKTKLRLICLLLFLLGSNAIFAQNRITVSKRAPINLDFTAINNAGIKGQIIADNTQWLNYTVLVGPSEPRVSISVDIGSGSIPNGIEMFVEASNYKGFSRGKMGTPTGKIPLTHMPKVLIDNIGTSYTGSGRNEGHQITFSFIITNYAKLEPGIHTIYVQYTLTQ